MVGAGRAARARIMPYGAPSNGICKKTCSVGYTGFRDDRARPRASKIDYTNPVLALL
jgi:hypothetical protein